MKSKKIIFILLSVLLLIFILVPSTFAASYPKLISTLNSAFEKIESWIIKISTPAAAISIGSGVLMKKFSFDGYCLAHIKVNSILREKRLVLGLTQQQVADKAKNMR